jgi:trehalose 6-phosphate synthase/phosphatase
MAGIEKGMAALAFLGQTHYDFCLAIGDDWTDEDLFSVLPVTATSIKVGLGGSIAKYYLRSYQDVREFLTSLTTDESNQAVLQGPNATIAPHPES